MVPFFKRGILFFLLTACIHAQINDIEFFRFGIEQGLTHTTIYSIIQDKTGLMWFGSQEGLIKYDGTNFGEYTHSPSDSTTISNSSVSQVLVIRKNDIIAGTWGGGINLLNRGAENFNCLGRNSNITQTMRRVQCIEEDKNGNIWIGTAGAGILCFNWTGKFYENLKVTDSSLNKLKNERIWSMKISANGLLWIGAQSGLYCYNRSARQLKKIDLPQEDIESADAYVIRSLYSLSDNSILAGTMNGFYSINPEILTFRHILIDSAARSYSKPNSINCFLELPDKSLLAGTNGGGLIHLSADFRVQKIYTNKPGNHSSISSNDIRCLYRDQSGLIWIGTRGGGVNTTLLRPKRFFTINNEPGAFISLIGGKDIRCITSDKDGGIWIGTNESGLNYIAPDISKSLLIPYRKFTESNVHNRILACTTGPDNAIWLATDRGLHRIPSGGRVIEDFPLPRNQKLPFPPSSIRCLLAPDNEKLIIGTNGGGVFIYNYNTDNWKNFNSNTAGFGGNEVLFIQLKKDELFAGTNNGVTIINLKNMSCQNFGADEKSKYTLHNSQIWSLCISRKDDIWIGTTNGLILLDRKTKKMTSFDDTKGFQSSTVYGILEDSADNLWLSTPKGIIRFSPASLQIKNYNDLDGLRWNVFNPGAQAATAGGSFIFGGVNGISIFFPGRISDNLFVPAIFIKKFDVFENGRLLTEVSPAKPINVDTELTFSYTQNVFRIAFSNTNYQYAGKNKFAYMLEGLDFNWQYLIAGQTINYSGLTPGVYVLRLRTANNDNLWAPFTLSIRIVIEPPFYSSWWFRILIALLIISAVFTAYRRRIKNLENMQATLTTLVNQKTAELLKSERQLRNANATKDKFFSIIAHDLRSPFQALISYSNMLTSEFDSMSDKEKRQISTQIETVSRRTYSMLENLLLWAYSQTGKLKPEPREFELAELLLPLVKFTEQQAAIKSISVSHSIPAALRCLGDLNMMQTVFRNLLSNAVKYTPDSGIITVTADAGDGIVNIHIKDSGIGMDKETVEELFTETRNTSTDGTRGEKGSGLGLILCHEFVKLNNGRLLVNSKPGYGSDFIVTIPGAK